MKPYTASTVIKSRRTEDAVEVTLADASGRKKNLRITADLAQCLAHILAETARSSGGRQLEPTKMPRSFAVGTGKHDAVVLVRFESDAPYGLTADDASELGQALIEQSEAVQERPQMRLQ